MNGEEFVERVVDEDWDAYVRELEAERPPFLLETEGRVEVAAYIDRLLERAGACEMELDFIQAEEARLKAKVEEWAAVQRTRYQRRLEYAVQEMRMLVEAEALAPEPGKKTRSLPHGVVGFRKAPASVEIMDEDKALAFSKKHGLDFYLKEEPRKKPLKEYAEQHGGRLPESAGARYVPGEDRFYYNTNKG